MRSFEDEEQDTLADSFDNASYICAIRLRLADFHPASIPKTSQKIV